MLDLRGQHRRVIGAGTGRTGTMSLKLALEQLGFGPCYHMIELLQEPARVAHWEAAFGGRPVDWDAALAGYRSTVDFPSYLHYRALMRQYPEAKVILTLRDPESWYESALTTIYRAKPGLGGMLRMAVRLPFSRFHRQLIRVFKLSDSIWRDEFGGRFTDRAYAIEVYNRHLAEVRSHVPRERLQAVLSGHVQCGEARLKGITEPVIIHWLRTAYAGL